VKLPRVWKRVLLGLLGVVVLAIAGMTYMMGGPRNVVGMLRYDQREKGTLKVGDQAPDVTLVSLDGTTPVRLASEIGGKPTVLVFGSFT
jgi:hypothetical protein